MNADQITLAERTVYDFLRFESSRVNDAAKNMVTELKQRVQEDYSIR